MTSLKKGCSDLNVEAFFKAVEVDCSTFGYSVLKMPMPSSSEKLNMT